MSATDTLRELKKISRLLLLSNASTVEKEIAKIASTNDRKKMWVLLDGTRSSKDIADLVGVTQRGVQVFLRDAKLAEFVEYEGDHPKRILDYVPPSWIELMPGGEPAKSEKKLSPDETLEAAEHRESKNEGT